MRTTNFSKELVRAVSAVVVGIFLACMAPNAHAGEFKNVVPTVTTPEECLWNGPYLAFNSGGVFTNYNVGDYTSRVDLTTQFNIAIGATPLKTAGGAVVSPPIATTAPEDIFFLEGGRSNTSAAYIGGVDLGYNFQFGHFVVGPVIGFSGTRTTGGSVASDFQTHTFLITNVPTTSPTGVNATAVEEDTRFLASRHAEQNWSGYAGAQVGFAWQRFLFYATGGGAFSQIDMRTVDFARTEFFDVTGALMSIQRGRVINATNNVLSGWYAGGGMQFCFTDKLRAGLEYRHSDYADRLYKFNHSANQVIFPGATRADASNNEIVFKVSLMLGHLGKTTK
jgi:opacity protein-like surface antigen